MEILCSSWVLALIFLFECALSVEPVRGHVDDVDPYMGILRRYNLTKASEFQSPVLQNIVHDFVDRIQCEDPKNFTEDGDHGDEECLGSFCIDVEDILSTVGLYNTSYITEETFDSIAVILLEVALDFNETCHTEISITQQNVTSYLDNLSRRFSSNDTIRVLDLVRIQKTLEILATEPQSPDHDHENVAEQSGGTSAEDSDDHSDNILFKEKCLGADVLFDKLGYDVESNLNVDKVGHIAAIVVFYILNGANISRDCRLLPRDRFFLEEIYHIYGGNNNTISHEAFENLLGALEIGNSQGVSHTEDDGHHHRRKREADEADEFLHKETWASTCYSAQQLLAIYGVVEDGIPANKFSHLCPALVQQKLAGVCVTNTTLQEETVTLPSTAERYGYGTIAVVIVCLCSAVGAFVVKCTSGIAYDVIIALFLGLATGTLYTDALMHLLPTAFGVHGHEEEDGHVHEEADDIVVESYVWVSLAASAGVYAFYLFEKVFTMVRGQHNHTHSGQEDIFSNKAFEQVDEKHKEQTDTETKKLKKTPVQSIAIMVCVADAVHNFADGIAMGAAFSSSLYLGISTTIAVICHELPHELGDFAILITNGLSFTRALVLNLLVSATAIVGLYVGLAISENESVKKWILAVTAGVFLYISLVNMLPQLLQKSKGGTRDFILNNVGILIGAGSMLVLAIFEERIRI